MVKMMEKDEFKEYYFSYLGYTENSDIVCSKNREKANNFIYYPVIVSFFEGKIIYSIAPKYFEELKEKIEKEKLKEREEIGKLLKDFFQQKKIPVSIQTMIRMTKKKEADVNVDRVIKIEEENKKEFFHSFEQEREIEYKEKKWERMKSYSYRHGIIKDNQFASMGFVSNISYKGANIVIETKEKYRNLGYGKSVVEKITRELRKDYLIPIYWVKDKNIPSKKLAEALLFEEKAEEIVVKLI